MLSLSFVLLASSSLVAALPTRYSSYNAGHNGQFHSFSTSCWPIYSPSLLSTSSTVVNTNDNDLIDLKDLDIFVDVLKRSSSSCSTFWSKNGGHNVENYNDNDVSSTASLFYLQLHFSYPCPPLYSSQLVDLKDLNIDVDILDRHYRHHNWSKVPKKCVKSYSYNGGHNGQ